MESSSLPSTLSCLRQYEDLRHLDRKIQLLASASGHKGNRLVLVSRMVHGHLANDDFFIARVTPTDSESGANEDSSWAEVVPIMD